jgi:hypothetical protein
MRQAIIATLGFVTGLASAVHAITIQGYSALQHDRFASGWATTPVPNTSTSFVGSGYDWSGVGWDATTLNRNIAMISPQYFVFAHHYQPGGTINFYSPASSSVVSYSWTPVTGTTRFRFDHPTTGQAGDFAIGKLATPLNPAHGIAYYPILDLPTLASYVGLPLFSYGFGGTSGPRIGTDTIDGFANLDLYAPPSTSPVPGGDGTADTFTVYHTDKGNPGNTRYQVGDSSGPLFVPWNGSLAIVGTHSAIGTDTSGTFYNFDNFIPAYLNRMTELGITFTTVPETGAFAGVAGLALLGFALWRRAARPTA